MEEVINEILIREVETKNIMTPLPRQKPAKKGQVCFGRFYL